MMKNAIFGGFYPFWTHFGPVFSVKYTENLENTQNRYFGLRALKIAIFDQKKFFSGVLGDFGPKNTLTWEIHEKGVMAPRLF